MHNRDLQRAILAQLTKESEPISLSELVDKLQSGYSSRTVRRWLNVLATKKLVTKFGQTKNVTYQVARHEARNESTMIETLKFDEIRVRYRLERRAVVRQVIVRGYVEPQLTQYVEQLTQRIIPVHHRQDFIRKVKEDLELLDQVRSVFLDVTPDQLENWLTAYQNSKNDGYADC